MHPKQVNKKKFFYNLQYLDEFFHKVQYNFLELV